MDIGILGHFKMGAPLRKQALAVFHILVLLAESLGSPVWMPQFLSGGQGRSIRHLPCVSRTTGEQGICMFAYTCLKANGTHLGTCIDRFYFGSCCKLQDADDLLVENHFPLINNNQVTSPYYPSSTNNVQSVSIQNEFNKITETLFPVSTKASYPIKTSEKVETSTAPTKFGTTVFDTTDKTIVNLAQHLATETYFLTSTDKVFVPIHTTKPNRTETYGASPGSFTTPVSNSGLYNDVRRPNVSTSNTYHVAESASTTTQPYLLSTFQVVHNQFDTGTRTTARPHATAASTSEIPTKPTSAAPSTVQLISTWTPSKLGTVTPTSAKKNTTVSRPPFSTTTKKPIKPVKPYATTRKPTTKKPISTTSKPVTIAVKTTTTVPVKKPIQPTKKPSSSKPTSTKPATKPSESSTNRPSGITASRPNPPTTTTPATTTTAATTTTTLKSSTKITAKPTAYLSTTTGYPIFTTFTDTTSEVVFTKPGSTSFPDKIPGYGITTFRPDLGNSNVGSVSGSGLTTFSYVSEGTKDATPKPPATTTSHLRPTKPDEASATISNEISPSYGPGAPVGGASETQEENSNVIYQQIGSTSRPTQFGPQSSTSSKPGESSVPFFPDAEKPVIPSQWIEMPQTSYRPEPVHSSKPSVGTTTPAPIKPSTVMPIFEGLNQSDYTQVCGRRIYPQARVVGGEKSTFGKWPWQISLRQWRTSTYLHKCGAALLNENWAITAAHCVENVPPSDLLLRLGEHDLSTEDEPFGFQERRVQIVASHPQFDPRTFEYDLALLRFYEPVKFQPNIIPVCVPEDNTNFVGQTAFVTGWGRLYEDGPLPSVLQEVSVPVINNTLCENMYRSAGYIEHIPEIFICAGWKKGGFDSCEGDSGGPMVIQRPDKRWLLAGVISWGIGCAEPNQPGVYTRISEFREWIHQILQF